MIRHSRRPIVISTALALSLLGTEPCARAADDANKVRPGEFIVDHPTLINLGFEWLIEGDANRNPGQPRNSKYPPQTSY